MVLCLLVFFLILYQLLGSAVRDGSLAFLTLYFLILYQLLGSAVRDGLLAPLLPHPLSTAW